MSDCCCKRDIICDNAVMVATVSTQLTVKDIFGAWKVRWGIGRMSYKVDPGLYKVGSPTETSPVLVSANYKLTFDSLRKELSSLDCWLLILDTRGVNVWCAAGKGTFGTDELVNRIFQTELSGIVSHRKLILPQLGAVGISAHEVLKLSGFSVLYGPIRARDIKAYLASGNNATDEMRQVHFTFYDRLVLTPIELTTALGKSMYVFGALFIVNLFAVRQFGMADLTAYFGAIVTGTVLTPVLLPYIPGRAFSWKGWLTGLLWTAGICWFNRWFCLEAWMLTAGYLLTLPALSAYLAMNFTGSSTYTSFSGVAKEMRTSIPLIIVSTVAGIILILTQSLMV